MKTGYEAPVEMDIEGIEGTNLGFFRFDKSDVETAYTQMEQATEELLNKPGIPYSILMLNQGVQGLAPSELGFVLNGDESEAAKLRELAGDLILYISCLGDGAHSF